MGNLKLKSNFKDILFCNHENCDKMLVMQVPAMVNIIFFHFNIWPQGADMYLFSFMLQLVDTY